MNRYGVKQPTRRSKPDWDFYRARVRLLRASEGSQATIRARRDALVEPPQYVDESEKRKRRERNRARKESPRTSIR